jgi:hypothetical protein
LIPRHIKIHPASLCPLHRQSVLPQAPSQSVMGLVVVRRVRLSTLAAHGSRSGSFCGLRQKLLQRLYDACKSLFVLAGDGRGSICATWYDGTAGSWAIEPLVRRLSEEINLNTEIRIGSQLFSSSFQHNLYLSHPCPYASTS